jgi:hypothetical protein
VLGCRIKAKELVVEAIYGYAQPFENALGGVVLGESGVVGEESSDVFW